MPGNLCHDRRGFSLIELLSVIALIAVLIILAFPAMSALRSRAQRAQCTANLKSLYVAADLYLQQNEQWPQIAISDDDEDDSSPGDMGNGWIAVLKPFGISEKAWICPTIQDKLGNPNYIQPENIRVDYVATPFDDKPLTPLTWPTQPWFVEVGNMHGKGNLIVFTDGSISDFETVLKRQSGQ
jgi:prepilin-type N-terminal cleavage/methylation domain-containing protein